MLRKTGIVLASTLIVFASLIQLQSSLSGAGFANRGNPDAGGPAASLSSVLVAPPSGDTAGEAAPYVGEQKMPAPDISIPGPPGQLVGAPYVTDVTASSALINWVLRGTAAKAGDDRGWRTLHSKVTGLRPGATYYYDVLRDGTGTGAGQFVTPPASGSNFSFVVYGDTRTREDVHRKVADKAAEVSPAFVIHTGDLVADGYNYKLWPGFFQAGQDLFRKTVLFPSIGNHEKNSPIYTQFFPEPLSYYSFNWGSVHVAVMNSDISTAAATSQARERFWSDELKWLENDLKEASAAEFRFVVLHHPPYTAMGKRQGSAKKLAQDLAPIFERYRVQAVFSGHDHNYQRHVAGGIQYVVTGGGGAPLYDADSPIPGVTQKVEKVENFVVGRVNGTKCALEAIAADGRKIDSVVISSSPAKSALPAASP